MSKTCNELHFLFSKRTRHAFPFDKHVLPANGIYVLFEKGEFAHGTDRIVRVGTHTGENQLRSRLKQHFVLENKDRSIFRKNIGRAILNRSRDAFLSQWEWDLTTRTAREQYLPRLDGARLAQCEKQVTTYMQENFQFCVWGVDTRDERLFWESKLISTVAQCDECGPSNQWLGLASPKEKIRSSGLWLVNELYGEPMSERELEHLERMLMTGGS